MKYLKLFETISKEDIISKVFRDIGISKYYYQINKDGDVDVNYSVDLSYRNMRKIPISFGEVVGYFRCNNNKLTSLEGCPKYISNNFSCSGNNLTSLLGCTKYVSNNFSCSGNNLTSLVGCPEYVGNNFECMDNNIRTFEGIGSVGRHFRCNGNPIYWIWILFQDESKIDTFNEWGVIQDDKVILYRLNDFLAEIGKDNVIEWQLNQIKKYYTVV